MADPNYNALTASQDPGKYRDTLFSNRPQQVDELGYTEQLPGHVSGPELQHISSRTVGRRNAQLMRDALGTLKGGLGNLRSYRPGGAAAMSSGLYQNMAQVLQNSRTYAPDIVSPGQYEYARKRARRKAKQARSRGRIGAGARLLATGAGAAIGASMGMPMLGAQIGGIVGGGLQEGITAGDESGQQPSAPGQQNAMGGLLGMGQGMGQGTGQQGLRGSSQEQTSMSQIGGQQVHTGGFRDTSGGATFVSGESAGEGGYPSGSIAGGEGAGGLQSVQQAQQTQQGYGQTVAGTEAGKGVPGQGGPGAGDGPPGMGAGDGPPGLGAGDAPPGVGAGDVPGGGAFGATALGTIYPTNSVEAHAMMNTPSQIQANNIAMLEAVRTVQDELYDDGFDDMMLKNLGQMDDLDDFEMNDYPK